MRHFYHFSPTTSGFGILSLNCWRKVRALFASQSRSDSSYRVPISLQKNSIVKLASRDPENWDDPEAISAAVTATTQRSCPYNHPMLFLFTPCLATRMSSHVLRSVLSSIHTGRFLWRTCVAYGFSTTMYARGKLLCSSLSSAKQLSPTQVQTHT